MVSKEGERRAAILVLAVALSYLSLAGGLLVFVLLVARVGELLSSVVICAYLALGLAFIMPAVSKPLERFGASLLLKILALSFLLAAVVLALGGII